MKRHRKNSLADLFRRHHGLSWKSAQLAKEYERRHPGYKPPASAKRHRGTARAERDSNRKDIISALRQLGYQKAVAEEAAKKAYGNDFDARMRSALAAASFGSMRRQNSMAKRRKRKKNSRRRRHVVRRRVINRRRRHTVRRRVRRPRARRRNALTHRRRRPQKSYLRSLVREMMGGRKRRKKNSRRKKAHRNPVRPRIIKIGSVAMAKKLARKLQGMGYRARYVKR